MKFMVLQLKIISGSRSLGAMVIADATAGTRASGGRWAARGSSCAGDAGNAGGTYGSATASRRRALCRGIWRSRSCTRSRGPSWSSTPYSRSWAPRLSHANQIIRVNRPIHYSELAEGGGAVHKLNMFSKRVVCSYTRAPASKWTHWTALVKSVCV